MTTYYIKATGGSDALAGTTTAGAFATVSKGCIAAVAGDTVVCLSGTYNASFYINTSNMKNGTTAAPITLMSVTPLAAMWKALAAPATGGGNAAMLECRANCWKISGFEFNGNSGYTFGAGGTATWALGGFGQYRSGPFYSGLGGIIENNYVHHVCQADPGGSGGSGIQGEGFYTAYAVSGIHIRYNYVHNCANFNTANKSHGIYLTTSTVAIYGNVVGVQFGGCNMHGWHGFTGGYSCNNTMFSGADVGILFGQGDGGSGATCANFKCFNNIVQAITSSIGIGIGTFGTLIGVGNAVANNIAYQCTKSYSLQAAVTLVNSIAGPPGFVSYTGDETGDYHLVTGSRAIDTGRSSLSGSSAPNIDIDGISRPQNSLWDLGAYEFVSGATGDTTPPAFVSAAVSNANPNIVVVTMNEALAPSVPANATFAVGKTIVSISISGLQISITCSTAYVSTDVITVQYTKPASAPWISDAAGNATASFGPNAVTNNVGAVITGSVGIPEFGGHERKTVFNTR